MGILNQWMGIAELASEHGVVVDQLLERNPARRPERAEQVAQALERCRPLLQRAG